MLENKDYYSVLSTLVAQNAALWQATIVHTEGSTPAKPGMKMLIPLSQKVCGNLGGGEMEHTIITRVRREQPDRPVLQNYLLSEQGESASLADEFPTFMICGGKVTVFIEALFSSKLLCIIGAGHCGRALAHLAGWCGFQVRLIDNRPEILAQITPEICSDLHYSDLSDLSQHIRFTTQTHIVIMTHGHTHDQHVLEQCLDKPCRYLGMIGSSRKVAATFQVLREKGYSTDELARVHAPIGLPIGSQTPYEIAVSVLAELIMCDSGKV